MVDTRFETYVLFHVTEGYVLGLEEAIATADNITYKHSIVCDGLNPETQQATVLRIDKAIFINKLQG